MSEVIVTVVIPTANRPQWLGRAIESALLAHATGQVEVIVVPNGPDESWKAAQEHHAGDERIRFLPIETPNGNAARTHGLRHATGRYVRFLDDDDYLLAAAARQVELLEESGMDLCSGLLANVSEDGADLGTVSFPATRDFAIACTQVTGFTLPTGNLFRTARLAGHAWDATVRRAQDYVWMLSLAAEPWRWAHSDEQVGVWFQHGATRTSTTRPGRSIEPPIPRALLTLRDALAASDRLDPPRAHAIAVALWNYAHVRFAFHPRHASAIAREAAKIAPQARPSHPLLQAAPFGWMPPLVAEWALLPARRVSILLRGIRGSRHDFRRTL